MGGRSPFGQAFADMMKGASVSHCEDADIDALFKPVRFRVDAGSPELYQDIAGTWRRWDPTPQDWI